MARPLLLAILMVSASLSGCFGEEEIPAPEVEIDLGNGFRPYTVIAPIDTGINPYHDHFQTDEILPDWFIQEMQTTIICNLTQVGTYQERVDADRATCWDTINATDIVYFPGTRIFAQSPDSGTPTMILDDPNDGHGTAVTGAVLDADPDAIIFFVEGFSDNAVLTAANHPMVDVITTSFGAIGSLPVPGIEDATKIAVVENHKIHTGAADNSP